MLLCYKATDGREKLRITAFMFAVPLSIDQSEPTFTIYLIRALKT
jgi:hypothetical protein